MDVIRKKYFGDSVPQNAKKASAVLTVTGSATDGKVVSIGDDTYEFDPSDDGVTSGNIKIDLSTTNDADTILSNLETAINDNGTENVTAVADTFYGELTVTYDEVGTEGNDISVSTDETNCSWSASNLASGQYATPAHREGVAYIDDVNEDIYITLDGNSESESNWRKISVHDSEGNLIFDYNVDITDGKLIGEIQELPVKMLTSSEVIDQVVFIANNAYEVVAVSEVHSTAESTAASLYAQVERLQGTEALNNGDALLTDNSNSGISLKGTADTVVNGTLVEDGTQKLNAEDRLGITISGSGTEIADVQVQIKLKRL